MITRQKQAAGRSERKTTADRLLFQFSQMETGGTGTIWILRL